MTVGELIQKLKDVPRNADVCVRHTEDRTRLTTVTDLEKVEAIDEETQKEKTVYVID